MQQYTQKNENLNVSHTVDVLVCGGGPAGFGAAVKAARMGAKTMVIEAQDCLGGISTAGMMSHWGGRSSSKILMEILDRMSKKSKNLGYAEENHVGLSSIHHEVQKIVMEEMAKEENIGILYYTLVCGANLEKGKITGVVIQNKSGRSLVNAKYIIDATGDGDVAYYAGVPFTLGREEDGKMQPCTTMFKIGGVDYNRAVFPGSFETLVETDKGELQHLAKKILPFPAGHVLLYRTPMPGTVCCNMTNMIGIDGTKTESLTKGVQACRMQLEPIVKFLREYVPGYENCWLMSSASLLGIRETRHFEGVKSLEKEDILEAKFHSDWVVRRAFFNFDVHNLTGPSLDKTGIQHQWKQQNDYTIPYGCLLPKNVEGLLLSGRNISGSHLAHSNFRIMSVCIALGEAAGAAAAIALKHCQNLKDVDVSEIQAAVGE